MRMLSRWNEASYLSAETKKEALLLCIVTASQSQAITFAFGGSLWGQMLPTSDSLKYPQSWEVYTNQYLNLCLNCPYGWIRVKNGQTLTLTSTEDAGQGRRPPGELEEQKWSSTCFLQPRSKRQVVVNTIQHARCVALIFLFLNPSNLLDCARSPGFILCFYWIL